MTGEKKNRKEKKRRGPSPSLAVALIPIAGLAAGTCFWTVRQGHSLHLVLIAGALLTALIGFLFYRRSWEKIEAAVMEASYTGFHVILFVVLAFLLNGFWLRSGILPTLLYYGGRLIPPPAFPGITLALFALVAFATGSSWVGIGMLGPSFMVLAALLGQPQTLTAGVILSGAFWGQRLSPLSLDNHLAVSAAGGRLGDHLNKSLTAAVPALIAVITTLIYFGSLRQTSAGSASFLQALPGLFSLNPLLLGFPVLFILLIAFRVSVIPAFLLGIVTGSILIVFFQQEPVATLLSVARAGSPDLAGAFDVRDQAYWTLLDRGGTGDLWPTVGLVLCAITLLGAMKASGMLAALSKGMLRLARGKRSMGVAAVLASLLTALASPDHHWSVALPGRILRGSEIFEGMEPLVLSRPLADSGPPAAALVPWSMTGIVMAAFLGVEVWRYAPWAVYLWISPLLAFLFAFLGLYASGGGRQSQNDQNGFETFSL